MAKISALDVLQPDDVDGSETLPVVKDGATKRVAAQPLIDRLAAPYVALAEGAAALTTYGTVAEGEAATAPGSGFAVETGTSGIALIYQRTSAGSIFRRTALSWEAMAAHQASADPDKGSGAVAYSKETAYEDGSVGRALQLLNQETPWLLSAYDGGFAYLEANASVRTPARGSGIGHVTIARSSTSGPGIYAASIGSAYVGVNDENNAGTWCEYGTGVQLDGMLSPFHLYEGDIAHLGETVRITPQDINPPGLSNGYRIMTGGELSFAPHNFHCRTASAALLIGCNDPTYRARWDKGIVFHEGFCETDAIAFGLPDRMAWYSGGNPWTTLNGTAFNQYLHSDGDCYVVRTTRLTATGNTPAAGAQLARHDFFDHGAGGAGDANASVRVFTLGGGSAGYQALARNATGTMVGVGINTQGDNSFAPVGGAGMIDLGTPSSPWNNVRAAVGTIQPSDARLKKDLGSLPTPLLMAMTDLMSAVTHGNFLDAIAEKGEDQARKHVWIIAQTIVEICAAYGVDAFEWGFVGHDAWMEDIEETYLVDVPVMEDVEVPYEDYVDQDGKLTIVKATRLEPQEKKETIFLWNDDGSPAMEQVNLKPLVVMGDNGQQQEVERPPLNRQRAIVRVVKQPEPRVRVVQRQRVDETGQPMMKLSVRTDEIFYGLIAATNQRLNALAAMIEAMG